MGAGAWVPAVATAAVGIVTNFLQYRLTDRSEKRRAEHEEKAGGDRTSAEAAAREAEREAARLAAYARFLGSAQVVSALIRQRASDPDRLYVPNDYQPLTEALTRFSDALGEVSVFGETDVILAAQELAETLIEDVSQEADPDVRGRDRAHLGKMGAAYNKSARLMSGAPVGTITML